MKIMAINAGSSTLKWKLFEMPDKTTIASGMIDRLGSPKSVFKLKYNGQKIQREEAIESNEVAVLSILDALKDMKIIEKFEDIVAFGHRVVAGGEVFKKSEIVTEENLKKIQQLAEYAPLHNKIESYYISVFKKLVPRAIQVAVFDTSFFVDIPEVNYLYSIDLEDYKKYHVRRYGAHGTSHRYIVSRLNQIVDGGIGDKNAIILHLGSGASISAIKQGKAFDISMGFTPLAGIMMSSRSGDIDFSIIPYLMRKLGISDVSKMIDILNNKSGLLGISGVSPDMRDVEAQEDTNQRAKLALEMYRNRILKFIGSYTAEMGGVDVIAFTAGVGENSTEVREDILSGLEYMGVKIDHDKNAQNGHESRITTDDSTVAAYTIPTNEELMIAQDTYSFAKYLD
ncbi:acetate/propionate family kinase [Companilactobacillus alimentarius]|uniref:Acetate kinase n=1 Tax=Companilactobacillus alimentarius DSM 20249 TaxID=1423720 RepID=A0A2K9HM35_9LACO|nr:acetate kinase [Companilactobacillus alimentarius]AUI72155.1 acetate kinase [Companilactobacillus alimentarius DSM 20249]KRK78113.1 acetate kinase [Companilactobacillus alimentarius DSM 20249]MDT6952696.1 acetate kinase [Companilactobacillus alimentarius]GEO44934.1 acetate kinase [Companilactobacillus alimentarius]